MTDKITLTKNSSTIFEKLLNTPHRVNSKSFENFLKISGAEVRECINQIIDYCFEQGYDYTVGSGRDGYFITKTEHEYDESINNIYSREVNLRERRQKLEAIKARKFRNANQMSMNLIPPP